MPAESDESRGAARVLYEGRTIWLAFGTHIIGRDETATVSIDSETVSRRHARLLLTQEAAVLEDLGSKNGTRLNGVIVRGATALADGDEIQVGAHQLLFRTRTYGSTRTGASRARGTLNNRVAPCLTGCSLPWRRSRRSSQSRPPFEPIPQLARLEDLNRHRVVLAGPLHPPWIRLERRHPGLHVGGTSYVVHLQVQHIARDEAEEDATGVQTDAPEHRSRLDVAELLELIEDERLERRAHLQRSKSARSDGGSGGHASIVSNSSTRLAFCALSGTIASSIRLPAVLAM